MHLLLLLLALVLVGCSPSSHPNASATPSGSQPAAAPAASASHAHLRIDGTAFIDGAGKTFQWRGISAFRLAEFIAHGREADAVGFLDWAARQQLTVVRVFLMAHHLFQLTPDDGIRALPRLLELAGARGLYVEIVALTDTAAIPVDDAEHVGKAGAIAARHWNALLEIANEPVHSTQDRRLYDPAYLQRLAAQIPEVVPVSIGAATEFEDAAAGRYVTAHFPRDAGQNGWAHVVRLTEGVALVNKWRRPVINDEPIGAGAEFIPGRRDHDPARFRAAALTSRLVGLGATFHYEGGLQARIPAGTELACFDGWSDGLKLLPAGIEIRGAVLNDADSSSVVVPDDRRNAIGVFERHDGADAWAVFVGWKGDSTPRIAPGWTGIRTDRAPGVVVVTAQRRQ